MQPEIIEALARCLSQALVSPMTPADARRELADLEARQEAPQRPRGLRSRDDQSPPF